ncbi:hypothetical protein HDC34_003146 [Pseudoclavibacter sp. JAI123]|uniref:PrpF domain-containing protein n=1 Tax=Pseudoclavibacter sp. JAI123 TaxID=2723065 RepID=UPI0015C8C271|nr:PrpF domain-containing protein [Pseudoclavibacter sp. JAI123]NYF14811.1 hypothetical protein [Pseudoclavibacter sp. JAI123]
MTATWIDAAFVRGGTSKGLFFNDAKLPRDRAGRDRVFTVALGSPDRFGRQLDGMGGGISSLSKVMVVAPSTDPDIDLEYTFGQVDVATPVVDYSGNCGNLSAGVVPFALLEGILAADDGDRSFRLLNTNTGKVVVVNAAVQAGQAMTEGTFSLPGVTQPGAPIELVYPDPAGSRTGALLPTGRPVEVLDVDGRDVRVSLMDAAVPLVIVHADDLGLTGTELPDDLDANVGVSGLLEKLRRSAAVAMGLAQSLEDAPLVVPKVAIISESANSDTLDGIGVPLDEADITVRMISMGRAHKAIPGTGAMCLAAAALTQGTIVQELTCSTPSQGGTLRMGTPSGVVAARAALTDEEFGAPELASVSLLRTARVLMRGAVAV